MTSTPLRRCSCAVRSSRESSTAPRISASSRCSRIPTSRRPPRQLSVALPPPSSGRFSSSSFPSQWSGRWSGFPGGRGRRGRSSRLFRRFYRPSAHTSPRAASWRDHSNSRPTPRNSGPSASRFQAEESARPRSTSASFRRSRGSAFSPMSTTSARSRAGDTSAAACHRCSPTRTMASRSWSHTRSAPATRRNSRPARAPSPSVPISPTRRNSGTSMAEPSSATCAPTETS